jgi:hypothetical protein
MCCRFACVDKGDEEDINNNKKKRKPTNQPPNLLMELSPS